MITSLIEEKSVPEKMVFTIQKEVAQRMTALPGCREYSSFSVICRVACNIIIEADIQGGSFYPVPDVTSSIISMTPHNLYNRLEDRKKFSQFLRIIFNSRRKTVLNNLKTFGKDKALQTLEEVGIPSGIRADNLDVGQIVSLYERIYR
jgi:16S rRNA (adenine1518-N6/adenine1519-N6)-dimethyltransferase